MIFFADAAKIRFWKKKVQIHSEIWKIYTKQSGGILTVNSKWQLKIKNQNWKLKLKLKLKIEIEIKIEIKTEIENWNWN